MYSYICKNCGKEFKSSVQNRKFCGNECRYKYNRQKNEIYYEENYAYMLLTKDKIQQKILFDIEDIETIKQYKWHLHLRKRDNRYDVCTNTYSSHRKRKYINMPRFLLNANQDLTVDHINHNTLDNRKINLRLVPIHINNLNKRNNTSGFVGVTWDKQKQKWQVTIKNKFIGRYDILEDAISARVQAEIKEGYFQLFEQTVD